MSAPPDDDDDEGTIVRPPSRRAPPAQTPTQTPTQLGHMLPVGTRLRDYEITGLIGEGGFGIVYLAWDHSLQRQVAVKEYMPASLVSRVSGSSAIVVKSERHLDTFRAGLKSFVNEARLLARFDHPSLVKVYRFWEENGTAYMVMPYYQGPTLKAALTELGRAPTESELRAWLRPLLDALAAMHAARCFHRDIAPDNILLTPGGPLLLDFGAARRVIGDMTHALTVVLKPGFAPIEQYGDVATMAQGAWTDLYALACVVYYAITGKTPMSSVERLMDDAMQPLSALAAGRYSPAFLRAIDAALSVRPQDRPQDVAQFAALLDADLPPSAIGMGRAGPSPWQHSSPVAFGDTPGDSTFAPTLAPTLAAQVPTQVQERTGPAGDAGAEGGDGERTAVIAADVSAPSGSAAGAAGVENVPSRRSRAGVFIVVGGALLLALGGAWVYLAPQAGDTPAARPVAASAPAPMASRAAVPPEVAPAPQAAPVAVAPAPSASQAAAPPDPPAAPSLEPAARAQTPPQAPLREAPATSSRLPDLAGTPVPAAAVAAPRVVPRAPREAPPRRDPSPSRTREADVPRSPYGPVVGARCSDILQKASLEPLTAEEAAYLKRECR